MIENSIVDPEKQAKISEIAKDLQLARPLTELLINRGLSKPQIEELLLHNLADLSSPFEIPGMQKTVERLFEALNKKQKVYVHGDYDCDGVTSSVLLTCALRSLGIDTDITVSNRLSDGYGPTPNGMVKLKELGASLVISTDCGITSFEAADKAKEIGLDLIITDHHNPSTRLPNAYAIVNPKLDQSLSKLHILAGVGVAFKLAHAFTLHCLRKNIKPEKDLRQFLDLVAIGTIADSCPLIGENRLLVKNGLKLLNLKMRPGLQALCASARINGWIQAHDITRRLAPKINAAGRVGDPMVSVKLLLSKNIEEARQHADTLVQFNRDRRQAESKAFAKSMELAKSQMQKNPPALFIVGEDWHPGIIGLIATKISRKFHVPTIILSSDKNTDELVGSGRSVHPYDLLGALKACDYLLESYGGHPMAAGLALKSTNLEEMRKLFLESIPDCRLSAPALIRNNEDHKTFISLQDMDTQFFENIQQLEPFGSGNPEPVFTIRDIRFEKIIQCEHYLCRGSISDESGIIFDFSSYENLFDFIKNASLLVSVIASPRRVISASGNLNQIVIHKVLMP